MVCALLATASAYVGGRALPAILFDPSWRESLDSIAVSPRANIPALERHFLEIVKSYQISGALQNLALIMLSGAIGHSSAGGSFFKTWLLSE